MKVMRFLQFLPLKLCCSFLFLEGGNMTAAKMVDLDTQAQLFSEIWGWRIRIGNLFSADFTPVPFKYIWDKMITTEGYEYSPYGAVYQSVLSNIRWIDNGKDSPFIKQLQTAMNNDNIDSERLSIRFNVDMYTTDPKKSTFTMGRVTGISLQSTVGKKMAAVHFTTTPCEPNTANRQIESHIFLRNSSQY